MAVRSGRLALAVTALVLLPGTLLGCSLGGDEEPADRPDRAPVEEADTKARERVQAYLDAMVAKDAAAGRNQFCAPLHEGFDAAATGPNGDFADHFEVSQATITEVRSGSRGQEVAVTLTVTAGSRQAERALDFTVTRTGADWCISGEAPGTPAPSGSPADPDLSATPTPAG
ncbi:MULTISPECIES: hypothetical protein [Micromonospora]|uniref:Nuclear transport factor 2 family protein n=1 Tax=Micromonospora yangpuensis TaxID=683228 RepID=A0A1C6V062_9ACTN|nr:hypothetical protein [Micromonospora yangpuensis]GGL96722.1 hypothetical protein GCM10012279_12750 [Micromonospora yangpuensis]SCL59705.1 hypothetical protein GA0070617_4175 [Micromonospora yangpuensis]